MIGAWLEEVNITKPNRGPRPRVTAFNELLFEAMRGLLDPMVLSGVSRRTKAQSLVGAGKVCCTGKPLDTHQAWFAG